MTEQENQPTVRDHVAPLPEELVLEVRLGCSGGVFTASPLGPALPGIMYLNFSALITP